MSRSPDLLSSLPNRLAALVLVALVLTPGAGARADEFHYKDLLVGDRASGLGGAYTAVSDDAAGLYYNPAGTTYAEGGSLSASMTAFQVTRTDYEDVLGGRGWNRNSQTLVPDFFGVVQPLGTVTIGFSYAVPDSTEEDQDQTFHDLPSVLSGVGISSYVINFNQSDNTYLVGPAIAGRLNDRLSIGLTLYGHYRKRQTILNQLVNLDNGQYEWTNSYFETEEFGVRPLLGVMWEASDTLALGFSLARTYVLSADTRSQVTFRGVDFEADRVDRSTVHTDTRRRYPLTATVGVALFPTHSLLLTGDFTYYEAVNDPFGDRKSTWNAALGFEYYLTPAWAVRTGLYSNRANTGRVDSGGMDQPPHVNLYGGTLSLSHLTRTSSVTLGGTYARGSGEDQVIGGSTAVQDVNITTLGLYLSASYRY